MKLSKDDVLWAVDAAVAPSTGYIHDRVCQRHRARVASGDIPLHDFELPTVAMLLRRLKALAADGMLTRSTSARGIYGYGWEFTDAGRAALKDTTHAE